MQTTLLGLAIALILALLTALIGPFFIDWTQYRPAFEAQASRALGLPVRVSGPIDVRLLPSPSLLLSHIEIGTDNAQQPLRATALGLELALGSLIRGQMRATELRLVGPDVALRLGKDGRINGPGLTVGLNLNDVSIGNLSVEDGRLSLTDSANGKQAVLDKLWFNGDVRSLGAGVFRGEGAFVLNGGLYGYRINTTRPDDSDTRIKLSLEPSDIPVLVDGEGALSFADGAPRFEGSLTLTRPVGVALASGKTTMGSPWRVTSRVSATPASALFEQLEMQYGPEERALKATGTAEMTFGESPRVEAVISARQLDLDRALASEDQTQRHPVAAIKALIAALPNLSRLPVPVQVGFGLDGVTFGGGAIQSLRGDLAANADGVALKGVEFRAPGFTQIQVSGHLKAENGASSFTGPAEINSVDPRIFVAWLEGKSETPAGAASPLRGRGDITIDDSKLAVERLTFEVDRKPVNGRLAYSYAAGDRKARLEAGLKSADADIDAMWALATALLNESKIEKPGEISLALDMDRARFAGLDAQRAHVTASFDMSGLKIERLNIGDFGGMKVDARGLIDIGSASPRGNMTMSLDAHDLTGLTALAAKFAPQSLDLLRGLSEQTGRARLRATLDVDTSDRQAGQSHAKFDLGGSLGQTQVALKGHVTGTLADADKAQLNVTGELTSDDATVLLRMAGLGRLVTADRATGKMTISASGPLNGDMRVAGSIIGSNLDAKASGRLRLFSDQPRSGEIDLTVAKADAGPLLQPMRSLPVALTTRATLSGSSLKFDRLSAEVAGVPVRGRLGLTFSSVGDVEGDIETDAVDLAALIAAASGLAPTGNLSSEEPFERGLYSGLTGRIAVRARSASLADTLVLRGAKGTLRFAPSDLGLEVEDAEFAKGRLSGEFSTRRTPDGTSVKTRIVLKGADAALVVPTRRPLSGRITLNAELDGSGRSPKALIGSLSGTGTLTLADARIEGLDPNAFAAAIRAVDQGLPLDGIRIRDIVLPALDNGALFVRTAEAPFTVTAGQVRFGTLLVQADRADTAMSGMLDLSTRTLDARIMLTDASATTSAGRPEISMQLKGPLASPTRNIDVATLTGWLALRAVEQQSKKLEEIERAKKLEAIQRGEASPVTSSVPGPASPSPVAPSPVSPPITLPERAPVLPRTRPAAEVRAAPLPPPVDIKPAPGFASPQGGLRPANRPVPQGVMPLRPDSGF